MPKCPPIARILAYAILPDRAATVRERWLTPRQACAPSRSRLGLGLHGRPLPRRAPCGACGDGAMPIDPLRRWMRTWRKTNSRLRWVNGRTGCGRLPHKSANPCEPTWDRRLRPSTQRSRFLAPRHHGKDIIESHRPQVGRESVGDTGGIVDDFERCHKVTACSHQHGGHRRGPRAWVSHSGRRCE
jgi:hypothetical protein